jgi:hypothetical protein
MKKTVVMSKNALLKEHKHLIKVLKHGTPAQQAKEAKSQSKEMKKYKAALSLPGGTEICNRDIECFGIGVPVIRPSLQINFEDPLIPNYHYISFYQPCDYTPMGYPSYQSYEDFKKNLIYTWNKVKNDKEYLSFIAENSKSWFDRNCKMESNLKFISKKINLNTGIQKILKSHFVLCYMSNIF